MSKINVINELSALINFSRRVSEFQRTKIFLGPPQAIQLLPDQRTELM